MRKSAYGPLRCDVCSLVLEWAELRILKRAHVAESVHLKCMKPLDRTRALVKLGGARCIFCGRPLLLPDLMDHFNARHGRTLVNW